MSVRCGLLCSLQIIEGYSMRNLTSGRIRSDVCQSSSWHPSHGGPAITEEEACLQGCKGSPDGCLWRRYFCCRAGVHCQFALMGYIIPDHLIPLSLSDLHWSKYDTFKSSGKENSSDTSEGTLSALNWEKALILSVTFKWIQGFFVTGSQQTATAGKIKGSSKVSPQTDKT